jgi:dihydroneopterin aldolase
MKTTVSLEGLEFKAFHGFYDEERKVGNTFICDVSVKLKSFDSEDDNIYDTVNYEDIYNIVSEEMKKTCKLIETVAFNIIVKIKELDHVVAASVKLAKLNPPLNGSVQKAVVEMQF